MGRPLRQQAANTHYHIFNRGVAKQAIFQDDSDRRVFLSLLGEAAKKFNLEIYAYCLMENHYHLFLQTFEANLSAALWYFTHQYARSFNFRHDRVGPIFQGRYQSKIVDVDCYALTLIRYIHLNPVESGLVSDPRDYSWSSYPIYLNLIPSHEWLNTHWALKQLTPNPETARREFIELHHEGARLKPGTFED